MSAASFRCASSRLCEFSPSVRCSSRKSLSCSSETAQYSRASDRRPINRSLPKSESAAAAPMQIDVNTLAGRQLGCRAGRRSRRSRLRCRASNRLAITWPSRNTEFEQHRNLASGEDHGDRGWPIGGCYRAAFLRAFALRRCIRTVYWQRERGRHRPTSRKSNTANPIPRAVRNVVSFWIGRRPVCVNILNRARRFFWWIEYEGSCDPNGCSKLVDFNHFSVGMLAG